MDNSTDYLNKSYFFEEFFNPFLNNNLSTRRVININEEEDRSLLRKFLEFYKIEYKEKFFQHQINVKPLYLEDKLSKTVQANNLFFIDTKYEGEKFFTNHLDSHNIDYKIYNICSKENYDYFKKIVGSVISEEEMSEEGKDVSDELENIHINDMGNALNLAQLFCQQPILSPIAENDSNISPRAEKDSNSHEDFGTSPDCVSNFPVEEGGQSQEVLDTNNEIEYSFAHRLKPRTTYRDH